MVRRRQNPARLATPVRGLSWPKKNWCNLGGRRSGNEQDRSCGARVIKRGRLGVENAQIATESKGQTFRSRMVEYLQSLSATLLASIAYRHRVTLADLVTDKKKERIAVWIYLGENIIAEVTISAC